MFNLASGKYLFDGKGAEVLVNNAICNISYVPTYIQKVSFEAQNLLLSLLDRNPDFRPSAKEALEHPWFLQDREALMDSLYINSYLCQMEVRRHLHIKESQLKMPLP